MKRFYPIIIVLFIIFLTSGTVSFGNQFELISHGESHIEANIEKPGLLGGLQYFPEEKERMIYRKAQAHNVPPVLVKAIALVESGGRHYDMQGDVMLGGSGEIGIMQVYPDPNMFTEEEIEKLFTLEFNVEAGIRMLIEKKMYSGYVLPYFYERENPGELFMDDNILETWYFALWAYNGWNQGNNPAVVGEGNTYQDRVISQVHALGQEMHPMPAALFTEDMPAAGELFPVAGKNQGNLTPVEKEKSRVINVDTLRIREKPALLWGRDQEPVPVKGTLKKDQEVYLLEGPYTATSHRWYEVANEAGTPLGWAAGIYKNHSQKLSFMGYLSVLSGFSGLEWLTPHQRVSPEKKWTVRFSQMPDLESSPPGSIEIRDHIGRRFPLEIKEIEEEMELQLKPLQKYLPQGVYILHISEELVSKKGDKLGEGLRMHFYVE